MKPKIVAQNKEHLKSLIEEELQLNGKECDLNHIDVSNICDMRNLFIDSQFNGDISKWDVSNVIDMQSLFASSKFNGDISKWDVSKVQRMSYMFACSSFNNDISRWNVVAVRYMIAMFDYSKFNSDISNWDVCNVIDMREIFYNSKFNGDISNWRPYNLKTVSYDMFESCKMEKPYWAIIEDKEERNKAINEYIIKARYNELSKELNEDLHTINNNKQKNQKTKI